VQLRILAPLIWFPAGGGGTPMRILVGRFLSIGRPLVRQEGVVAARSAWTSRWQGPQSTGMKGVTMAKFMMILQETPGGFGNVSPTELQRVIEKYQTWFQKLRDSGRLVSSNKLKEEGGKVLSQKNGRLSVVDGPYSELKEVVGGYALLRAETYEEAVELIQDCPHLAFGRLVLRQTDPMGCAGE
jgi:hypothetical protein